MMGPKTRDEGPLTILRDPRKSGLPGETDMSHNRMYSPALSWTMLDDWVRRMVQFLHGRRFDRPTHRGVSRIR